MILIIREPATLRQIHQMLRMYGDFIKIVVDTERRILAGGGELHRDCEEILLNDGSLQKNLWGADWMPEQARIEYESLINIRPSQNNRSMLIENSVIRNQVAQIVHRLLGEAA